jgi:CRISPR-associated protein Cmr4
MTTCALLFVHAVTPLHAGVGQGVGDIDLPIARERSTGIPYVPGSSIKGALRALADKDTARQLFGPDTTNADDHAGSVQISDARLLMMPVRSMRGVFAYATSRLLVARYQRDKADAGGVPRAPDLRAGAAERDDRCVVGQTTVLTDANNVWLEDLRLEARAENLGAFDEIGGLLDVAGMAARTCIVSDDVMSFLADTATEVRARIRLDESTRSVAKGALWYEEALPAESLLGALVLARTIADKNGNPIATGETAIKGLASLLEKNRAVQLGGKATVGKGVCALRLVAGGTP